MRVTGAEDPSLSVCAFLTPFLKSKTRTTL